MDNKAINEALAHLASLEWHIDNELADNGGEITDEIQEGIDISEDIRALLQDEGVDSLGRWLKAVQDKKATLKAEKDAILRKIKAAEETESYVRQQVRRVLDALGIDKAKGNCYSFTASDSRTITADTEKVKSLFADKVEKAIRSAGVPDYIGVTLRAISSAVHEGEPLPEVFSVEETATTTFRKPRASKA